MKNTLITLSNYLATNKKAARVAKVLSVLFLVGIVAAAFSTTVLASSGGVDLSGAYKPIVTLINSFVTPMLALVGAGGTLYCIVLGVKYATAEEPQEREKRKQALKTAIIGFVLIFVLIVALRLSITPLTNWMQSTIQGH
jgi:cytochrome bd-type quinol oxidase subunit 2